MRKKRQLFYEKGLIFDRIIANPHSFQDIPKSKTGKFHKVVERKNKTLKQLMEV